MVVTVVAVLWRRGNSQQQERGARHIDGSGGARYPCRVRGEAPARYKMLQTESKVHGDGGHLCARHGVLERTRYMKNRNIHLFMILWCSHRFTTSANRYSPCLDVTDGKTTRRR